MMTKTDFEAVARIVAANTVADAETYAEKDHNEAAFLVASDLADYFAETNDRFDRDKFMEACTP